MKGKHPTGRQVACEFYKRTDLFGLSVQSAGIKQARKKEVWTHLGHHSCSSCWGAVQWVHSGPPTLLQVVPIQGEQRRLVLLSPWFPWICIQASCPEQTPHPFPAPSQAPLQPWSTGSSAPPSSITYMPKARPHHLQPVPDWALRPHESTVSKTNSSHWTCTSTPTFPRQPGHSKLLSPGHFTDTPHSCGTGALFSSLL